MQWETPSYTLVNMSAEIGGYQDDFDRTSETPVLGEGGIDDAPQIYTRRQRPRLSQIQPCESASSAQRPKEDFHSGIAAARIAGVSGRAVLRCAHGHRRP
jgi:hypothetical protein